MNVCSVFVCVRLRTDANHTVIPRVRCMYGCCCLLEKIDVSVRPFIWHLHTREIHMITIGAEFFLYQFSEGKMSENKKKNIEDSVEFN